jgi:ERCC4-type nuclease
MSLKDLTTASLGDVLHLMNVDTAWGVNSIPNITPALQKCIRDKRPYVYNTREDLNDALRAVDGVGSVRAARIVDHFFSILQSKLTTC